MRIFLIAALIYLAVAGAFIDAFNPHATPQERHLAYIFFLAVAVGSVAGWLASRERLNMFWRTIAFIVLLPCIVGAAVSAMAMWQVGH